MHMQITNANIGDTLCLYQTGKYIKITDVTPDYVYYMREDGDHYVTSEKSVAALKETNPVRLNKFDANSSFGKVLNAAEAKAFRLLMNSSQPEIAEANVILGLVREQQKHFSEKLQKERFSQCAGDSLAVEFISDLSEKSTGSHDTFWGHQVKLLSSWSYEFQIDGKTMDYSSAKNYLSNVRFAEPTRKVSLNDKIQDANLRKATVTNIEKEYNQSFPER